MILSNISNREKEVLHLIAYEYNSKEIAGRLYISTHTVISHRKNLMSKLDVKNTAGLVRKALQLRLVYTVVFLLANMVAFAQSEMEIRTDGIVVPRLDRNTVVNPIEGQMVYDITTDEFWFFDGTDWTKVRGVTNEITDADDNTKIQVEETADDNVIRMDIAGTEAMTISKNLAGKTLLSTRSGGTFIGRSAGLLTQVNWNTFVGESAGNFNSTGISNSFFGHAAGRTNVSGAFNSFFGFDAGSANTTGDYNSFYGANAGLLTSSGEFNVIIGGLAGQLVTEGDRSVYIGYQAGQGGPDFIGDQHIKSDNIFIGFRAGRFEKGSDKLYIENSSADSSKALIYGEFNNKLLRINGTVDVNGAFQFPIVDGSNGQVLKTNGTGVLTWSNDANTPAPWSLVGTQLSYSAGNVGIGTTSPTADLEIVGPEDTDAIFLDSGKVRIRHNPDLIVTDRQNLYFLLDADDNNTNAVFGLHNNLSELTDEDPAVLFNLDGGESWINSGDVGIGTSDPEARLEVFADKVTNPHLLLQEVDDDQFSRIWFRNGNNDENRWAISAKPLDDAQTSSAVMNFNYTDSTSSNVFRLRGNGNAALAGTLTQNSDIRLKKNISKLEKVLPILSQVSGYSYNWKDRSKDQSNKFGLIAQEVQQIYPELVEEDEEGILSVDYIGFVPLLLESIKEQQVKIERQEMTMAALLKEMVELRSIVIKPDSDPK